MMRLSLLIIALWVLAAPAWSQVSIVGTTETDSGGWNGTAVIDSAGNSLVFWAEGSDDGTPTVTSITSSLDGAADVTSLVDVGSRVFFVAVWYNATAGSHTIAVSETGIGEEFSSMIEVADLDIGQGSIEASNSTINNATTVADTGSVSVAGPALLLGGHSFDSGAGAFTWDNGDTVFLDGSREYLGGRAVSASGSYNASGDHAVATNTESAVVALAGVGGGGGPANATYCVRADGTATFAGAADGATTDAAQCMNMATFDSGRAANLIAGDSVTVSWRGGEYTDQFQPDVSDVDYDAEAGGCSTINISGAATDPLSALFMQTTNAANIRIGGCFVVRGNGTRAAVRHNELGTGSSTVQIGVNADGSPSLIQVLSNNEQAVTDVADCVSTAGNSLAQIGLVDAQLCTESTPSTGSNQCLTSHDTSANVVAGLRCRNSNDGIVTAGTSSITVTGTVDIADWYQRALEIDSGGGTINLQGGGRIVAGTDEATYGDSIFNVNTTDGGGVLTLKDVYVELNQAGTTTVEDNYGGTVLVDGGHWVINADKYRLQPNANGLIEFRGTQLELDKWDTGSNFIDNLPQSGTGPVDARFTQGCHITSSGAGGGRLVDHPHDDVNSDVVIEDCVIDGLATTAEVLLYDSGAVKAPIVRRNIIKNVGELIDSNVSLTPDANNVLLLQHNVLSAVTDVSAVTDEANINRDSNLYVGGTPAEESGSGSVGYPTAGSLNGAIQR
ncbi:MAG: hypothetical protein AAFX44_06575 [Pseudomonadota bacterium]